LPKTTKAQVVRGDEGHRKAGGLPGLVDARVDTRADADDATNSMGDTRCRTTGARATSACKNLRS